MLKVPVFGDLIRKTAIARFTRTLGTLVSSGVPILDALTITGTTAGNKVVEEAILATRSSISEGKTIAEPLIASKVFPPMVCQMIAVGETTGALDAMLQKIADFYEDEVDNAVANLTALMEPMVILFLGIVIGGLVISMYLPIFKLGLGARVMTGGPAVEDQTGLREPAGLVAARPRSCSSRSSSAVRRCLRRAGPAPRRPPRR